MGSSTPLTRTEIPHHHLVHFYEDDAVLSAVVADFLSTGIRAGKSAVVIATEEHRSLFRRRLEAEGLRPDAACTMLDARDTLSLFMIGGMPDWDLFRTLVGGLVEQAAARSANSAVVAYGEMVNLLWRDGNREAALRLEEYWNDLAQTQSFSLLCAYVMGSFYRETDSAGFDRICRAHSHVLPLETPSGEEIARLQQRARALEAEVAHRKELEQALREANRDKDRFLAVLGHELRNPLTSIGFALSLLRSRLGKAAPKELEVIDRQTALLARLTDDLLDVSRAAQGMFRLQKKPIEVAAIVAKALETSAKVIEERQHRVEVRVPDQGLCVDGDEERLTQVVANLLTNAAKYTDDGGSIRVRAEAVGRMVVLQVRDNGIGIEKEALRTLFDPFVRARGAERSPGGLGLGLAIAQRLIVLHGGALTASSEGAGRGSEFTITIPLR